MAGIQFALIIGVIILRKSLEAGQLPMPLYLSRFCAANRVQSERRQIAVEPRPRIETNDKFLTSTESQKRSQ